MTSGVLPEKASAERAGLAGQLGSKLARAQLSKIDIFIQNDLQSLRSTCFLAGLVARLPGSGHSNLVLKIPLKKCLIKRDLKFENGLKSGGLLTCVTR